MLFYMLPIVGGFVFLSTFAVVNRRALLAEWEEALSDRVEEKVQALHEDLALDPALAARAHGKAEAARASSDFDAAAAHLRRAVSILIAALPARLTRLRGMAVLSRMAAAVTPGPAVQRQALRLTVTRIVMSCAAALGHLLVGAGEQFRWRLSSLAAGYRVVGWQARRAGDAATARPQSEQPPATVRAAIDDVGTLDQGQVEAYRALLTSLDSSRR